uniref:C2H2-type domain-containing protein n=1 Tax=viral metagenome TaxID=1070528 RepID=A0A6C0E209_9ZZZZ
MVENDSRKTPKIPKQYCCNLCDYSTYKSRDYAKHLATDKHKNATDGMKMVVNDSTKSQKVSEYKCECGKIYKYDSGYYRHKKTCSLNSIVSKDDPSDKDSIIMMLLKQNTQLIEQNSELVKKYSMSNTTNHVSNTNSHNKTFNLQFFLNETCKDAMNIMEFVDSIKLQLSDLEKLGEIGYIEGISDIISSNLKSLDVTQRPIHCTDKKREVLYIKDEDKWEKEADEKKKVRKAIHVVANKNIQLISKFKEAHPDCVESDSQYSDQYHNLIMESMGGAGDNYVEKENKIIRNILKTVTIDKKDE